MDAASVRHERLRSHRLSAPAATVLEAATHMTWDQPSIFLDGVKYSMDYPDQAYGVQSEVVVTFDPHPSEVVRPGSHPPLLSAHHHRAELVADLGVDALLIIPFTSEFSKLSPSEFVRTVLVDGLHAKLVVEGPSFRFGHKAAGDVDFLSALGLKYDYELEVVDLFMRGEAGGGEPFSSSLTRRLISAGPRPPSPGCASEARRGVGSPG